MQVYLYAKSGHAIGLDEAKRCAAIAHYLEEFNPILCTSDFRAGAFAKDLLEVKKYVNMDVLRNMYNIMNKNDILLFSFSSDEANEQMVKEIQDYSSLTFNLDDIKEPIVDQEIYTKNDNPKLEKTFFFGDDDYDNNFLAALENNSKKFDLNLLMGHYFFLGNEKIFKTHFAEVIDEEEYVETIQDTKFLLTSSIQSALESISCGNSPVLFKREDKEYDENLIKELNIPVINETSIEGIITKFEEIIKNYPIINEVKFANFDEIKSAINHKIELFKKLTQN